MRNDLVVVSFANDTTTNDLSNGVDAVRRTL